MTLVAIIFFAAYALLLADNLIARICQRRSNSNPPSGLNAEVKLTHLDT